MSKSAALTAVFLGRRVRSRERVLPEPRVRVRPRAHQLLRWARAALRRGRGRDVTEICFQKRKRLCDRELYLSFRVLSGTFRASVSEHCQ